VILAAIGTVVVVAYSTVWELVIFGMLPCLVGVVGIILTLIALNVRRRARTKESPGLSKAGRVLLLIGIFLMIQGAYYPVALGIRSLEVNRTQNYLDTLTQKLEEYKNRSGVYPSGPDLALTDDEEVPRLLQLSGDFPLDYDNRQYYFQRGGTYGFQFYLPDGFIGFQYEYCCGADGEWTVTD
jgi:hypothetical protein